MRENLVPLLIHSPVGGRWLAANLDVFYMCRELNALGSKENGLLTGSIGLINGLFLTSDLPSQRILFSADGAPLAYPRQLRRWRTRAPRRISELGRH